VRAARNPRHRGAPLMAVHPDQARVHTARLSAGLQLDSSPGPIFCPCTARAHPLYNSPRTGCRSSMLPPAGRTTRLAAVPSCSVLGGCEHSRAIPPPPRLTRTSGSSRVRRCRGGFIHSLTRRTSPLICGAAHQESQIPPTCCLPVLAGILFRLGASLRGGVLARARWQASSCALIRD